MSNRARRSERLRRQSRKAGRRAAAQWRKRTPAGGRPPSTGPKPPLAPGQPTIRASAKGRLVEASGAFADLSPTELDELAEIAEHRCPICDSAAERRDHPARIVQELEWDTEQGRFVPPPPKGGHP